MRNRFARGPQRTEIPSRKFFLESHLDGLDPRRTKEQFGLWLLVLLELCFCTRGFAGNREPDAPQNSSGC